MQARLATIQLARFDRPMVAPAMAGSLPDGTLFGSTGADVRATGGDPGKVEGFVLLCLGLHANREAAREMIAGHAWPQGAVESYSAILRPFRQTGEANFLGEVGTLYEIGEDAPSPEGPVCVMTSVGWNKENLDMKRVQEFVGGVMAVRISMTGNPALHSQQSFLLEGVLRHDPITLTFWKDESSMTRFAYAKGVHRHQMDKQAGMGTYDRGSFTRFVIEESAGTWYGTDPATFRGFDSSPRP